MRKNLRQLMLIISILALSGCNLQTKMLYYPSSYVPSQESLAADNIQFWPVPNSYRGFVSRAPAKSEKGTVVVFHGNAGTAADRAYYVKALAPLGYRVILAEYPVYGGRSGELGEVAFVSDAKETVRLAFEKYGKPVFLVGESLGCGVAGAVARETSVPIDGIILITPWDSLLSIAKEKFIWLPVRIFLKDKYDTVENMKAFQGRVAIVGAEWDEVIPVRHAQRLYESLPGNKKMWVVKRAGHNDWPGLVRPSWWKDVMDFITEEQ